ncbi:MAG: type I-C CRISPR-associated protein Cas8c/Csd1 [Deltaproteobacteria bacterium]|nr:type I-C CRISPR-associated protein Cas8c/Csd1 [Deltaproteobacteria bacterium]
MILQALNHYYERLKEDPETDIPLFGFGKQKIHFALVINEDGKLVQIRDLREKPKNKPIPISLTVPQIGKKRSVDIEPNFMWDNTGYVLGRDAKGNDARALKSFQAFKKLHHDIGNSLEDRGMKAVLRFLDSWNPDDAQALENWDEKAGANLIFHLDGERLYIHEHPAVKQAWIKRCAEESSAFIAMCLVNGETTPVARLHPAIKGVQGSQSTGAGIVSFNLDAFLSYGKKQNFNAPVSEIAAFGYTTALNHLLRFESRQRIRIGDASTVFWTNRASPIEGFMGAILDPRGNAADLADVRLFLEAVRDGKYHAPIGDPDIQFYILGLSPNASRLSVRFWHVSTVGDLGIKLGQHFRDLAIARSERDPEFPGMWQLLKETAVQGKTENIAPLLAGALTRSILTGAAYPQSLLSALIGRIRADQNINYLRTAMIKACLNRKFRIHQIAEEVAMSLDKESTNIAYRLGRLFAVLEKAQKDAIPGANTTIRDRFYGSASATPSVVFPQLIRLAQHHLQKAEYGGRSDKMIEEVMSGIEKFPTHLSLDEQGMFAVGYYHQRQAFYAKSENLKEV